MILSFPELSAAAAAAGDVSPASLESSPRLCSLHCFNTAFISLPPGAAVIMDDVTLAAAAAAAAASTAAVGHTACAQLTGAA
jgi:hypothetical protein